MKLLLFDIDGTILTTPGTGRRAVEESLGNYFGQAISTEGIVFSGKTDQQIIREVLEKAGLDHKAIHTSFHDALIVYTHAMKRLLRAEEIIMHPGLRALLEHLHERPDVTLALLTGNVKEVAYLKLRLVGLDGIFPFGAFGSDAAHRDDLPAIALERAYLHTGRQFGGADVVIIGDTEHDIRCSRIIGATAVAVCTGNFTRDDLLPFGPDIIFDDLENYPLFLRAVLGDEV